MARGARKYPIPAFLSAKGISQEAFGRWLDKVTVAHLVRDRKRIKEQIVPAIYRRAIYHAVIERPGRDYYTGEELDWTLLQHFAGKRIPEREEKKVPTVDHENISATEPVFRICSMRTNKCKSDYEVAELVEFAKALIEYQEEANQKTQTTPGS